MVDEQNIPKGADIIDSTWAMKKKANGDYRVHLAARGFKQTQGKLFVHHNISSPMVHDITVQIVLVLMLMGGLAAHLVDVNGTFFLGQFKPEEKIYMKIPLGFKKFYPSGGLLFLKHTLYGIKNASKSFWKLLLGIMDELGYKQNQADPCLYYKWDFQIGLIFWLSFINNMLIVCDKVGMTQTNQNFTKVVDCNDIGPMQEYIGTKIDVDEKNKSLKITQPVLVQSLKDKFTFSELNVKPEVPAIAGTHLLLNGPKLCGEDQTKYCSGIGKLLYLMRWSCPEVVNSVCELTRFMTQASLVCIKGLERVMQHVLKYPKHGMVMQPDGDWDRSKDFEFEIDGISDLEIN